MRIRPIAVSAVLVVVALGAAGCSSGGSGGSGGATDSGSQPATGTVTVKYGGKVICVMTIKNGKGTCTMPTKGYAPGTLTLNASYSGDLHHRPAQMSTSLQLNKP